MERIRGFHKCNIGIGQESGLIGRRLYQYIMRSVVKNTKGLPVYPFSDWEVLSVIFTSGFDSGPTIVIAVTIQENGRALATLMLGTFNMSFLRAIHR
jgi:hypothetical protein